MSRKSFNKYEKSNFYSRVLFGLQLFFIVIFLVTGPVVPNSIISAIFVIIGLILGNWAIISMRSSRFNLLPDYIKGAKLIMTGPYKIIRHPMYSAILIVLVGLWFIDFSMVRMVSILLLFVVLYSKANYEEKQLKIVFPEYLAYIKKTSRFIPYII